MQITTGCRVVIATDERMFDDLAASEVLEVIGSDRLSRAPNVALPTGRTPVGMYRALVSRASEIGEVNCFAVDEYVGIPPADPHSFHFALRRQIVDLLPGATGHLLDGSAPDPETEAARHEIDLAACGGLDLAILGLGKNGHLGFNEPGSPFTSRTRLVRLSEETRRANAASFRQERDVPDQAITMGIGTLLDAAKVLLLVAGARKMPALARLIEGTADQSWPVTALLAHPHSLVIVAPEAVPPTVTARMH